MSEWRPSGMWRRRPACRPRRCRRSSTTRPMSARSCRTRVLAAIRDLGYAPSTTARNLRSGRSQLIALVVADLANPFFSRVVWAAEAAVAAWGYALVVFNSDEKPEAEKRILARIRALSCDGVMLVPVGDSTQGVKRDIDGRPMPTVLFGRTVADDDSDTVTIDNLSAGRRGDQLPARPRPPPDRHGDRAAPPLDRQGPLRGDARGDEGARPRARAAARALGRVPRGRGLFGGAEPPAAARTRRARSTWRAA